MIFCRQKSSVSTKRSIKGASQRGFSLTEMITTISVLGILAGIVIVSMSSNYEVAREILAKQRVEMLNEGLSKYATAQKEITTLAINATTNDERLVLLYLQYRNPIEAKAALNSPYVEPRYRPAMSSSSSDYRIRWNCKRFEMLNPGENGSGFKMVFDGSEMGTPFVYPPNFNTSGS
jgi:prepilin-type N-terminal cleavage/methylation domain-containing protein